MLFSMDRVYNRQEERENLPSLSLSYCRHLICALEFCQVFREAILSILPSLSFYSSLLINGYECAVSIHGPEDPDIIHIDAVLV